MKSFETPEHSGLNRREFISTTTLASTGLLGALHVFAKKLKPELSHVLADAALITPLLLFVIR